MVTENSLRSGKREENNENGLENKPMRNSRGSVKTNGERLEAKVAAWREEWQRERRKVRMGKMEGVDVHLHADVNGKSDFEEDAQFSCLFFLSR